MVTRPGTFAPTLPSLCRGLREHAAPAATAVPGRLHPDA